MNLFSWPCILRWFIKANAQYRQACTFLCIVKLYTQKPFVYVSTQMCYHFQNAKVRSVPLTILRLLFFSVYFLILDNLQCIALWWLPILTKLQVIHKLTYKDAIIISDKGKTLEIRVKLVIIVAHRQMAFHRLRSVLSRAAVQLQMVNECQTMVPACAIIIQCSALCRVSDCMLYWFKDSSSILQSGCKVFKRISKNTMAQHSLKKVKSTSCTSRTLV